MATLDQFTWCIQLQNGGGSVTTTNNDREVVFGNGYRQRASSGFNTTRREMQIVYSGKDYKTVYDFLQAHRLKPFAITPPDGRIGIFIVKSDSVSLNPVSKTVQEVKATISEQFTSMV